MDEINEQHDLFGFFKDVSDDLSKEYNRISNYVKQDPGTAGDQGEENWAEILRSWLPKSYDVVTKGRILGHDGSQSSQVDFSCSSTRLSNLLEEKQILSCGRSCSSFRMQNHLETGAYFTNSEDCN